MTCTEAYKEHIMYSFNGFCKVVIRYAAINAWRDRNRRQKEISFEYLTEEKFYPLNTSDEALKSPYEQYPVTICGQTIILTNGELAEALLSLPEKKREVIYLYFFRELYAAGNRGNIREWKKCGMAPPTQCLADVAGGNGGAFAWGILTLYPMKRLSGRPAATRKPWTRFYGIMESKSGLPPLKTGTSTQTQSTA